MTGRGFNDAGRRRGVARRNEGRAGLDGAQEGSKSRQGGCSHELAGR
jgi:hypothetical protein